MFIYCYQLAEERHEMNIILTLEVIMKQKGSKIFSVFHLLLVHFFHYISQCGSPIKVASSGRDLILVNFVRLIDYIDFRSYGSSRRKLCTESKHVFILLKKFEASVRKVEFCF